VLVLSNACFKAEGSKYFEDIIMRRNPPAMVILNG
jgi:hypothetical protein